MSFIVSQAKLIKNKLFFLFLSQQGPNAEVCVVEENRKGQNTAATSAVCRTKETCAQLCLDTFSSIALQLPCAEHRKNLSHYLEDTSAKSLIELLVSDVFFFQKVGMVTSVLTLLFVLVLSSIRSGRM